MKEGVRRGIDLRGWGREVRLLMKAVSQGRMPTRKVPSEWHPSWTIPASEVQDWASCLAILVAHCPRV
jgi:hypothetical protein